MVMVMVMVALQVQMEFFMVSSVALVVMLTLIALTLLLVFVKRPSPSREASGAISLTIAAVILLSGVWSMWLSPTYDTRRYDEITTRSLTVEPLGSATVTFDAKKGQDIEVSTYYTGPGRVVVEPQKEATFPIFSVKIYDPAERLIWTQTNITNPLFQTPVGETGRFKVVVSNPQGEALSLTVSVRDVTRTTVRPLEPFGQWLTLISLPVFALGVWFARFRKVNQTPQST